MTKENAIEYLKCAKRTHGTSQTGLVGVHWTEVFDLAIKALEKQIAKPLVNRPVMSNTSPEWAIRDRFYCPCCGEYVGNCNLDEELLSEGESHCPHCGQNLKEWSE